MDVSVFRSKYAEPAVSSSSSSSSSVQLGFSPPVEMNNVSSKLCCQISVAVRLLSVLRPLVCRWLLVCVGVICAESQSSACSSRDFNRALA